MPLDRIVLVAVIGVAGLLVASYLAAVIAGVIALWPFGLLLLLPVAFIVYIVWRVVAERVTDRKDQDYDRFEH